MLFMPNWYESTASVFPVDQFNPLGTLGRVSSSLKTFSHFRNSAFGKYFSKAIGTIETDRCVTILKSKKVLSAVIQKFDLVHVYDIKTYPLENTIKELLKNTEFKVVLEGNIFITVCDKDPQRAADMANYFVEILNKTNSEIIAQSVQSNKQFVNTYYMSNIINLTNAEDSLKRIQKKSGIVSLPEQTKAYIKTTGDLAEELVTREVQANILRKTLAIDHPSVRAADVEIEEMQKKLIDFSDKSTALKTEISIFDPFSRTSDFSTEYVRRYRDVETQYKILQSITSLYEQAKVEGQWKTPAVIVLDRAIPAEKEIKPQRALIIFGGLLIGLSSAFVFSAFDYKWKNEKKNNTALYKLVFTFMNEKRAGLIAFRIRMPWLKNFRYRKSGQNVNR